MFDTLRKSLLLLSYTFFASTLETGLINLQILELVMRLNG